MRRWDFYAMKFIPLHYTLFTCLWKKSSMTSLYLNSLVTLLYLHCTAPYRTLPKWCTTMSEVKNINFILSDDNLLRSKNKSIQNLCNKQLCLNLRKYVCLQHIAKILHKKIKTHPWPVKHVTKNSSTALKQEAKKSSMVP